MPEFDKIISDESVNFWVFYLKDKNAKNRLASLDI